jgi:hypothetical protein
MFLRRLRCHCAKVARLVVCRLSSDPPRPRGFAVCLVLLLLVDAWGCGSHHTHGESAVQATGEPSPRAKEHSEERWVLTLEHDMGLVRPNAIIKHEFRIHNPTSRVWTIREVAKTCNCTMARPSSDRVVGHSTVKLTVQYRMPSRSVDKSDTVIVRFKEADAPEVLLLTRARVRASLTFSPDQLAFGTLARGRTVETTLHVYNYGDSDWDGLSINASDNWLTAQPYLMASKTTEPALRQVWRIVACCDTASLVPGSHQGRIAVSPSGTELTSASIPVYVNVMSPVEAVPRQLFFGKVKVGSSVRRGDWRTRRKSVVPTCNGRVDGLQQGRAVPLSGSGELRPAHGPEFFRLLARRSRHGLGVSTCESGVRHYWQSSSSSRCLLLTAVP